MEDFFYAEVINTFFVTMLHLYRRSLLSGAQSAFSMHKSIMLHGQK